MKDSGFMNVSGSRVYYFKAWRQSLRQLAAQVVQAIGAAEAELLNWGLPKRIDGDGAINLIQAAEACGVTQYLQVLRV